MITEGNRYGIIYDFIPGDVVYSQVMDNPIGSLKTIIKMALLQSKINSIKNESLPKQKDRLAYLINSTDKIKKYKQEILEGLIKISNDKFVCHGDFHVGNIIDNKNELFVIDWMNCYAGDKETDILRSYLTGC